MSARASFVSEGLPEVVAASRVPDLAELLRRNPEAKFGDLERSADGNAVEVVIDLGSDVDQDPVLRTDVGMLQVARQWMEHSAPEQLPQLDGLLSAAEERIYPGLPVGRDQGLAAASIREQYQAPDSEPSWVRRREWLTSDHPGSNSLGGSQKLASVIGFHPSATYIGREWDAYGRFTYAVIDLGAEDQNREPTKAGRILITDQGSLEGARGWASTVAPGHLDQLDPMIAQIDADANNFAAGDAGKVFPHGMLQKMVKTRAATPDPLDVARPAERPSALMKM